MIAVLDLILWAFSGGVGVGLIANLVGTGIGGR